MANWNDTDQRQGFGSVPRAGDAVARQETFDAGLRKHMLSIYNYMTSGVLLTGVVALLAAQSGLAVSFASGPLMWIVALAPLGFVLAMSFGLNAFGPILLAQAIESLLPRDQPFHFASLSARVGSIGDNSLGGWYSYRASKAAQNQLLRPLAIEWKRRLPLGCVSLLHPGTTATELSRPFQAGVAPGQLFSPARAAHHLLDVLEGLGEDQSGHFWAWDGSAIPW